MILDKGIAEFSRPERERGKGNVPPNGGDVYLRCWYGERVVGMRRFFEARQAGAQVDSVIRVLTPPTGADTIWMNDSCKLSDGWQYKVVQIQSVRDDDSGEDVLDVSLERVARV